MKKCLISLFLMPLITFADKITIDGVEWTYHIVDGAVFVGAESNNWQNAVSRSTHGALVVPSVINGKSVRGISRGAFSGCEFLTSVTIPSSVVYIGGLDPVPGFAFGNCSEMESFVVAEDNAKYSSRDGMLCSKDGKVLFAGRNGDVIIPSCVEKISLSAFSGRKHLKAVTIPPNVLWIAEGAFGGCSGLTSFTVDEHNTKYSSRNGLLCSKDGSTVLNGVNGSVTIPDGVRCVAKKAFLGCTNLIAVTFPQSVTNIENCAFDGCRGLKSVTVFANVTNDIGRPFVNCPNLKTIDVIRDGKVETVSFDEFRTKRSSSHLSSRGGPRRRSGRGLLNRARNSRNTSPKSAPPQRDAQPIAQPVIQTKADPTAKKCESEREEQRRQLLQLREELKKAREAKRAADKK